MQDKEEEKEIKQLIKEYNKKLKKKDIIIEFLFIFSVLLILQMLGFF